MERSELGTRSDGCIGSFSGCERGLVETQAHRVERPVEPVDAVEGVGDQLPRADRARRHLGGCPPCRPILRSVVHGASLAPKVPGSRMPD